MNNLGTMLMKQNRLDEAVPLLRESVSGEHKSKASLAAMHNLGYTLEKQGGAERLAQAESLYRAVLDAAADYPELVDQTRFDLIGLFKDQGKIQEAVPLLRDDLAAQRRTHGKQHSATKS